MKILIVDDDHKVKMDDDDYTRALPYHWKIQKVFRHMKYNEEVIVAEMQIDLEKRVFRLHRFIMFNPPKDYAVKFKDNDSLNMQKSNLYLIRYCRTVNNKRRKYKTLAKRID